MDKNIAILAGDGIGPEVMQSAVAVLDAVALKFKHKFNYTEAFVGGAAYDKYSEHLPQVTIDICNKNDAVLFGSVGGPITDQSNPKWKNCETNSILAIRKAFNFNINLRKATIYSELVDLSPLKNTLLPNGLDVVIFRELLGDIYFGEHFLGEKDGLRFASDVAEYNEEQIKSIAKYAFNVARIRKQKLISVDKVMASDCSRSSKRLSRCCLPRHVG